ncbi:MAG: hypothetical protein WA738_07405, partial [Candidatus Angelobacter sp.]
MSFLLGFAVFLLGAFLESTLDRFNITGVSALIDNLLIGILVGVLVFAYELSRHKAILRQMRI